MLISGKVRNMLEEILATASNPGSNPAFENDRRRRTIINDIIWISQFGAPN